MLDSDGSVTSESTVATESLASQRARCLMCGGRVPSQRVRRGAPKVYCTDRCRFAAYDRDHPRQQPLEFPTDRKETRAEKILRRLGKGPATGLELLQAGGGTRYGARVHDLRERGYRIVTDMGKEWPTYRLEE